MAFCLSFLVDRSLMVCNCYEQCQYQDTVLMCDFFFFIWQCLYFAIFEQFDCIQMQKNVSTGIYFAPGPLTLIHHAWKFCKCNIAMNAQKFFILEIRKCINLKKAWGNNKIITFPLVEQDIWCTEVNG